MHRRSFIAVLVGGLTAAAGGGVLTAAQAAEPQPVDLSPLDADALDEADAAFTHMPPGPRWRGHRAWHRQRWRQHQGVERGNAARTFVGERFVERLAVP